MTKIKKPEITDYVMKHATAFRVTSTSVKCVHPYYNFVKKDGVWYRRRTDDVYTGVKVKELINRIMNDCDVKKINYDVVARKPNLDFNWFAIVGKNGKRERIIP